MDADDPLCPHPYFVARCTASGRWQQASYRGKGPVKMYLLYQKPTNFVSSAFRYTIEELIRPSEFGGNWPFQFNLPSVDFLTDRRYSQIIPFTARWIGISRLTRVSLSQGVLRVPNRRVSSKIGTASVLVASDIGVL